VEPIRFPNDQGNLLEGEIRLPDGASRGRAVICHAHPRFGGSKDHPILWAVRIALAREGFTVLSFNFRGVMGSEGSHDGGRGEVGDVRAAIDVVEARSPDLGTFVFGWSFGANVALREAVTDERVSALALCGVPLDGTAPELPPLPGPEELAGLNRPVLLAAGGGDEFSPVDRVRALRVAIPGAELEVFPGASHFFPRREKELAARVARFAASALFPPA
jgi:uncharacterized protein